MYICQSKGADQSTARKLCTLVSFIKNTRTKHSLNRTINPVLAGSFNPDPSGNHILIESTSCNKKIKALKFAVNAVERNTTGMQFLTRFVYQLLLKYAFIRKIVTYQA